MHSLSLEDFKTLANAVLSNWDLNSEPALFGAPFHPELHCNPLLFYLTFGRQKRDLLMIEVTCSIALSLATQQQV